MVRYEAIEGADLVPRTDARSGPLVGGLFVQHGVGGVPVRRGARREGVEAAEVFLRGFVVAVEGERVGEGFAGGGEIARPKGPDSGLEGGEPGGLA